MVSEKFLEASLTKGVKLAGGICFKLAPIFNSGLPDRLVIIKGGKHIYLELKTEKGKLSVMQIRKIGELKNMGCDVRVIYGGKDLKIFLDEITQVSNTVR